MANSAHWETPMANSAHWETPMANSDHWETPMANSAHWETPMANSAHWETPMANSAHWETPRIELVKRTAVIFYSVKNRFDWRPAFLEDSIKTIVKTQTLIGFSPSSSGFSEEARPKVGASSASSVSSE
jgi:hypothetical protein